MIHFGDIEHGWAIAKAIPRNFNPAVDRVISRTNNEGELLGGVIFDYYTGPAIFMHQAGFAKNWINRDMLWVCFDYPFNQLKCNKIFGTIPSSNPQLLAYNKKIGFTLEVTLKGAYPGADMLVLAMDRDQCRWLDLKPSGLKRGGSDV